MPINSILLLILLALVALAVGIVAYYIIRTRLIAAHAERMVPPIGRFIDVGGNRVHYVDKGAGRPILFIHGLGAQLYQFHGPLFGRFPAGYRLVALDRPGAGYSTRAAGATGGASEQALAVRKLIDALGLEKPLVVGHSLGGAIALTLAVEHPDAISGLALISPHTHQDDTVPPQFAALNLESPLRRRLTAETVAVPLSAKYAKQTLDFIFGPQQPPADYMTAGGGYLGLRPGHFYGTATDFVGVRRDYPRFIARFGEIRVPVAILYGTADQLLDYEKHGLAMRDRIPGLDLELLDGVGHMPQFADPERTVGFIERVAARAFAR